jgi:dipeptidyl aminopeptidase/acylaminoacyl peptidase
MADIRWRQRFTAPQIWDAKLAGNRPDRGLVVSSQDGTAIQLFAWEVDSGRLTALTDAKYGVVTGWIDPAGEFVYYLHDEDGSELGHLVRVPFEGGPPQDVTPGMAPYTLRGVGFDGSGGTVAFNPVNADGFALYTVGVTPQIGEPRLLHRDSWETWGALLSARGDLAACWSTARAGGVRRYTLLAFDTATGEQVGELGDGRATVVGVRFCPVDGDGRILAGTAESGFTRPVVWDPRSDDRQHVTLDELTGDVEPMDWSADGRRLLLCQLAGAQRLHVYDLDAEEPRALSHPHGTYVNPITGGVGFGAGGAIVGLREVAERPGEVVELDPSTGQQRRVLLAAPDAPPGRPWRSVTFESGDGTAVQAWVATPDGTGPFPTILETHGGPHYTANEAYDPSAQFWLDHGYAWISVNYRGSLGFGRDFAEQIWGDLGHRELADMVAARDWLVAQGIARADEIFLFGGSYGGYLTLFGLGKRPDLWVGGMAIAADADLAGCYEHSSDALRAAVAGWMRGTPAERPEAYARSSPITYAADVAAPVLVIQFRNDTRVPPQQMEGYERRMRELGKDIEVVWLDGGHQSGGPDTWVRCHEKMLEYAERVRAGAGRPQSQERQ